MCAIVQLSFDWRENVPGGNASLLKIGCVSFFLYVVDDAVGEIENPIFVSFWEILRTALGKKRTALGKKTFRCSLIEISALLLSFWSIILHFQASRMFCARSNLYICWCLGGLDLTELFSTGTRIFLRNLFSLLCKSQQCQWDRE